MTVRQWIEENEQFYLAAELTIVNEDNTIILDDRLAYLPTRSRSYNRHWEQKCKGREIKEIRPQPKGIVLVLES